VFFDDSPRNISSGKAAGFHTVIVSSPCINPHIIRLLTGLVTYTRSETMMQVGSSVLVQGADVALESIHNIREALPELWEAAGDHVDAAVDLRSAVVAETTVLA
jgi:putative hydrolase of the HAD superfamily/pyrimidine and pyridine-specific 5'-nucleotidase